MMNYIIVKYPQDAKVVLGSESEHKSIVEDIIDDKYFKKYIQTHGHHFTEKLAEHVSAMMKNANGAVHSWSPSQIKLELNSRGERNYGHCTLGDLTYLANMAYADFFPNVLDTETACIKYAIAVAHDIDGYDGIAFSRWLSDVMNNYDINIEWENYV